MAILQPPSQALLSYCLRGTNQVRLEWEPSKFFEFQSLFIKEGVGSYSQYPDASSFFSKTFADVTDLTQGVDYSFKLVSTNDAGSVDSNEVSVTLQDSILTAVEIGLINWAKFVSGFDSDHVIFLEQNAVRPSKPYIGIKYSAVVPKNRDFVNIPNNDGEALVSGDREFVVSVNVYSDGDLNPIELLLNLHASFDDLFKYKILQDAGIVFVNTLLPPSDTSLLLDSEYERRGSMDLLMRFPWSFTDVNVGLIESASIEGSLNNAVNTQIVRNIDI